jgi:hypothetical protein
LTHTGGIQRQLKNNAENKVNEALEEKTNNMH